MDWIEQWLGVAPDNGDGMLEFFIDVLAGAIGVVAAVWRVPRLRASALRWFARLHPTVVGPRAN